MFRGEKIVSGSVCGIFFSCHIKRKQGECWHELISFSLSFYWVYVRVCIYFINFASSNTVFDIINRIENGDDEIECVYIRNLCVRNKRLKRRKWNGQVSPVLTLDYNFFFFLFSFSRPSQFWLRERGKRNRNFDLLVPRRLFLRMWINRLVEFWEKERPLMSL